MTFTELSGLIPVTTLYVGLHGLLAVVLANFVLYVRLRQMGENPVPEWQPEAALRVQANFIENVPLAMVMLLVLELQGVPATFLHLVGASLFVFRLLHAYGLGTKPGANYPRLIGAQGTFVVVAIMGVGCLVTVF